MAYQSIFNSNGVISLPNISAQFVPGQYAKINAQIAAKQPVNPQTLSSAPALTTALKAGQINQNQFAQRYNSIFNKPVAAPYSVKNSVSALGGAVNKMLVQPVVNTAKIAPTAASLAVNEYNANNKALPKATQAFVNATKGSVIGPLAQTAQLAGTNLAANSILSSKSTNQAEKAAQLKDVINPAYNQTGFSLNESNKSTALKGAALVGEDIATAASADSAGESVLNGIKSAKQAFIDGPQAVLDNSVRTRLLAAGEKANTPTNISVEDREGAPANVPVRTPVRPGIRQESTTSQINVRTPNQMTDEQFTKEFNQLSKSYDKDTKQLGVANQTAAPADIKAAGNKIEANYQGKLNDLLDRYHNPDLTAPKAPKTVASSISKAEKTTGGLQSPLAQAVTKARSQAITRPSALDRVEPTEPVAKTAETGATKPTETATAPTTAKPTESNPLIGTKKPTETSTPEQKSTNIPAQKVSGSSLRTQSEAVQAGMKAEDQATGATYNTVSHKAEAEKAVKLVQEDPQKAMDIATGKTRGDNASHEAAVYHAVKNAEIAKAQKTGDFSTVTELANSPRHTGVSEAAQKLGAEGYNTNPHDPIAIMNDLAKNRASGFGKNTDTTLAKETAKVGADVKAATPRIKREDWHTFVDSLKC